VWEALVEELEASGSLLVDIGSDQENSFVKPLIIFHFDTVCMHQGFRASCSLLLGLLAKIKV
jgi:hypothetical protein